MNRATLRTGEATLRPRIINTTAAGADQAQPKAYLSSKLSQITVSPSADHGPWPLRLRRAYVYVFLPLCSEPLCLTPLASHLSLSPPLSPPPFPAHGSRIPMPMYYGWGKINRMRRPFIRHTCEITGQERLKWSNKARGDSGRRRKKKTKKVRAGRINAPHFSQCLPLHGAV